VIVLGSLIWLVSANASVGPFAYIANSSDNTVSVIDASTNKVVGNPIAVGNRPTGVAVNPTGTRAYVANDYSGNVSVIDVATNKVVGTIENGAYNLIVNPSGTLLYLAGGGRVQAISASTNTAVGNAVAVAAPGSLGCPGVSGGVAINPAGTRLYVTTIDCRLDSWVTPGGVSVIDTQQGVTLTSITVGNYPTGIVLNPAGTRAYVTNWASGTISVIDTATNTTIGSPIVLGDTTYPMSAVVSNEGSRLYVANNGTGGVSVIDSAANNVIAGIPLGSQPIGIAITSDDRRLYVTNEGSDNVSVIDTRTNAVIGNPIAVGRSPVSFSNFLTRNDDVFGNGFESP
jgi:YVTN family beta-propeller protein